MCIRDSSNITPKLHCLNYDQFTPCWVNNADVAEVKRELENRIRLIAERYRDRIAQKNFGFQSGNYKTIMQFYDTQPDISLIYEGTRQYTDSQSLTCLPLDPIPWSN